MIPSMSTTARRSDRQEAPGAACVDRRLIELVAISASPDGAAGEIRLQPAATSCSEP